MRTLRISRSTAALMASCLIEQLLACSDKAAARIRFERVVPVANPAAPADPHFLRRRVRVPREDVSCEGLRWRDPLLQGAGQDDEVSTLARRQSGDGSGACTCTARHRTGP